MTHNVVAAGAPPSAIRTLVVDPHPVFRHGLGTQIHEDRRLELAADTADGRSALHAVRASTIDVVVMDLDLPDVDGVDLTRTLSGLTPAPGILILSAREAVPTMFDSLAAGARGFLTKHALPREICDAIVSVHRGDGVLGTSLQGRFIAELCARERTDRPTVSVREREILRFTSLGMTNREIARQLHLSPATVKTYLQRLYERFAVTDRTALVGVALRSGYID